jgi:hypothetical protein
MAEKISEYLSTFLIDLTNSVKEELKRTYKEIPADKNKEIALAVEQLKSSLLQRMDELPDILKSDESSSKLSPYLTGKYREELFDALKNIIAEEEPMLTKDVSSRKEVLRKSLFVIHSV